MRLSELAQAAQVCSAEVALLDDPAISRVSADSRSVEPGDLFVCMPSESRDTHSFLLQAKKSGARAAIVHSASGLRYAQALGLSAIHIAPTGSRFNAALGRVCREIFEDPTAKMRVIGITGTNGKTTTAWILRQALTNLGRSAHYLGTLGYHDGRSVQTGANTTPFPVDLWNTLQRALAAGATDFVLEASSHALLERRLSAVSFDAGVYLNLSRDHLDFHGTMEAYAESKKLLFTECAAGGRKPFTGVINRGDSVGESWLGDLPCRVFSFGEVGADIFVARMNVTAQSAKLAWQFDSQTGELTAPLGGTFNAQNVAAAFATLCAMGHDPHEVSTALMQTVAAPGRFEPVPNDRRFDVIIDYAHTPDALDVLLAAARDVARSRVICVFGCGGDRDPGKRPLMAASAARASDVVILTSDNPRTESPAKIIADAKQGIPDGSTFEVVVDRREAIHRAIQLAQPGDVVVIAGKGHEDYQIIGRTKHPFDDRQVAREALS